MNEYEKQIKSFASYLFSLPAFDFTLIATILGYLFSLPLTTDEQNSLGNFFELVGQVLLTFNAQNQTLQDNYVSSINATRIELKQQLDELRSEFEKLKRNLR